MTPEEYRKQQANRIRNSFSTPTETQHNDVVEKSNEMVILQPEFKNESYITETLETNHVQEEINRRKSQLKSCY